MPENFWQCFLLHARAYQDNALLVEFFTVEHGRIGAVAKNITAKKNNTKAILQTFMPLAILCQGKGDLLRLQQVEVSVYLPPLIGQAQICGFYVNELVMYSLLRHEPQPLLFDYYRTCLDSLRTEMTFQAILRTFECQLLTEMGYGINFFEEVKTHNPIQAGKAYHFQVLKGFSETSDKAPTPYLFQGEHLQAIARQDFADSQVLQTAKRLMRLALQPLLHGRVIHSRQLLVAT